MGAGGDQPGGINSSMRERLMNLATRVDPDPWRARMRRAVLGDDPVAMRNLAESEEAASLPPESIWTLGLFLWDMGHEGALLELLKRAQRRYPGDFFINFFLGSQLQFGDPRRPGEAVRYYLAAYALRPSSSMAAKRLTTSLVSSGEVQEAKYYAELYLERVPDDWRLMNRLAWQLATLAPGEGQDGPWAVSLVERALDHVDPALLYDALNTWGGALCSVGSLGRGDPGRGEFLRAAPDLRAQPRRHGLGLCPRRPGRPRPGAPGQGSPGPARPERREREPGARLCRGAAGTALVGRGKRAPAWSASMMAGSRAMKAHRCIRVGLGTPGRRPRAATMRQNRLA